MSHPVQALQSMMDAAAKTATDTGEGIALNLTRLLNEIESQAPGFRGMAGSRFQAISTELGAELRKILEALNTMADNVNQSGRVFGATDQDAANEIAQVGNEYLPGAGSITSALRG